MAGLLDMLGGGNDPRRQQQMMALAGGLLTNADQGFGPAFGQGLLGMQQAGDQYDTKQLRELLLASQLQKLTAPQFKSAGGSLYKIDPSTGEATLAAGAGNAAANKPLPVGALKQKTELEDAMATASNIEADLSGFQKQVDGGDLDLGTLTNIGSSLRNWAGYSTSNSRNYDSFRRSIEKLRNDSLRLNKGVQTEGDSQRAWNELLGNLNDEQKVSQRLAEIQEINRRAAQLKGYQLNELMDNYGRKPSDMSGVLPQSPITSVGRRKPSPARGNEAVVGGKLNMADQRVMQALDAGYSEAEILQFLQGK